MPNGKAHTLATLCTAIAIPTVGLVAGLGEAQVIPATAGCLIGLIDNPDLDVDEGSIAYEIIRKVPLVGPLLSKVWWVIWRPYAVVVPHRSIWSHSPLGTLVRLIYLAVWVLPFWLLFKLPAPELKPWHGWLVGGLFLGDLVHVFMDFSSTGLKRLIHGHRH